MLIMPSFQKSLIVEQFQGNYLNLFWGFWSSRTWSPWRMSEGVALCSLSIRDFAFDFLNLLLEHTIWRRLESWEKSRLGGINLDFLNQARSVYRYCLNGCASGIGIVLHDRGVLRAPKETQSAVRVSDWKIKHWSRSDANGVAWLRNWFGLDTN